MIEFYMGLNEKMEFYNSKGNLPWMGTKTGKADLQDFQHYTFGKNILMGRKTFQCTPLLRGRNQHVLSRNKRYFNKQNTRMALSEKKPIENVVTTHYECIKFGNTCTEINSIPESLVSYVGFIPEIKCITNVNKTRSMIKIANMHYVTYPNIMPDDIIVIGGPETYSLVSLSQNIDRVVVGLHLNKSTQIQETDKVKECVKNIRTMYSVDCPIFVTTYSEEAC